MENPIALQNTDMIGHHVKLQGPAKRIVSLVPSQTELLFDLGLDEEVVGITKFCIHPEKWLRNKTIVGGTKNFKIDVIRDLKPDLIIANKEENEEFGIKELQNEFAVWTSDIFTLNDSLKMIQSIGTLCDREEAAQKMIQEIETQFGNLTSIINKKGKTAIYYIWKSPWLVAGKDTFIDNMLEACGFINLAVDSRYPEIDPAKLKLLNPDYILLSSEPFPFKQLEKDFLSQFIEPEKIKFVDGTYFSWYGSRLKQAPSYFKSLFSS